tara:strand:+ start:59 stop:562 length:504 start_codon:yes stop_codon:yes gene_type:complete
MILNTKTTLPRPRTVKSATVTSAGTLITSTSEEKTVFLVDLINGDSTNMATLKHGAITIAQIPAGGSIALNAPIEVAPFQIRSPGGYAIGNGITFNVFSISSPLASGTVIAFTGGGVFTLTSAAAANANSYSGNLTVAAVNDSYDIGYTKVKVEVVTSTKFTATYMV